MASIANATQMRSLTGARFYGTQPLAAPAGGGNTASIISDYEAKYNTARQANESRYQDILNQYRSRYDRAMQNLEGAGTQQRADLNTQYDALGSRTGQDLVSRGLAGTTIAPSMQAGVERERAGARGRLDETLLNQRLQTDANLSADTLSFMERRTDAYPDANLYARMLEMAQPQAQGSSLLGRSSVNGGGIVSANSPVGGQVRYNGRVYGSMAEALAARDNTSQQRVVAEEANKTPKKRAPTRSEWVARQTELARRQSSAIDAARYSR